MELDLPTRTPTVWSPESTRGKFTQRHLYFFDFRFYPSKVKALIEEVVVKYLQDREYDHLQAKTWAEDIVKEIR